jgi:hypothetical protein
MLPPYQGLSKLAWLALLADAELGWSAPDLKYLRELSELPDPHPIVARAKEALNAARGHVVCSGDGKYTKALAILAFRREDFPGTERVRLF